MLDGGADGGLQVWGIAVPVNANGVRIWPEAVKAIAIRKVEAGGKVAEIARDAGVNTSLVYKWLRAAKAPDAAPQFVEVIPPPEKEKCAAAPPRAPVGECTVRLGAAQIAIPAGFPASELTGILLAVKAVL